MTTLSSLIRWRASDNRRVVNCHSRFPKWQAARLTRINGPVLPFRKFGNVLGPMIQAVYKSCGSQIPLAARPTFEILNLCGPPVRPKLSSHWRRGGSVQAKMKQKVKRRVFVIHLHHTYPSSKQFLRGLCANLTTDRDWLRVTLVAVVDL